MTASSPRALEVRLHGQRIGVITRLAGDRHLFAFEEAYINDSNRPTLSLSFKGSSGGLVTSVRPYNIRLPPFFSNLLPEGHLREYLAARAGVNAEREFFLLSMLGADLPGAITVCPVDATGPGTDGDHVGGDEEHAAARNSPLRFSLAGVQLKFSAIMEASGGLTIPADGSGGSWIVKLPSTHFEGVPENEFVMLELARSIGIPAPRIKLVPVNEIDGLPRDAGTLKGKALAVERFDRKPGGGRVHTEDFAQVFGIFPGDKYEKRSYANIAQVLAAEAGQDAAYDFVRRLVFTVLIGNGDMHLKNWSLLYPDGRKPILAPAYDYVSTVAYLPDDRLALGFGGSRSLTEITAEQIRRFTEAARLPFTPVAEIVGETVQKTVESWKKLDVKEIIGDEAIHVLGKHIRQVVHSPN